MIQSWFWAPGKLRFGALLESLVHDRTAGTKETRFHTFEITADGKRASYRSSEQSVFRGTLLHD